jgi:hypothetical protein
MSTASIRSRPLLWLVGLLAGVLTLWGLDFAV